MIFSNGDKCELDDGSDTPFLPGLPVDRKPNRRTVMSTVTAIILSLAGSMVLLCCGFALGRSTVSPNRASYYQPADYENTLGEIDTNADSLLPVKVLTMATAAEGQDFIHHPVRFNGSFFHRSVYGGKPNPQLDEAWSRFTHAGTSECLAPFQLPGLHQTANDENQSLCQEICQCLPFQNPRQRGRHLMTSRRPSNGKMDRNRVI